MSVQQKRKRSETDISTQRFNPHAYSAFMQAERMQIVTNEKHFKSSFQIQVMLINYQQRDENSVQTYSIKILLNVLRMSTGSSKQYQASLVHRLQIIRKITTKDDRELILHYLSSEPFQASLSFGARPANHEWRPLLSFNSLNRALSLYATPQTKAVAIRQNCFCSQRNLLKIDNSCYFCHQGFLNWKKVYNHRSC